MANTGSFLSSLKKGQQFTMPGSPFPQVVYTKGIRLANSNYYYITWEWDGEKKRSIAPGHRYCKPVSADCTGCKE